MRIIIITFGLFVSILLLIGAGCERENASNNPCLQPYSVFESLSSQSGLIGFNEKTGTYFIQFHIVGTIDATIIAYPCELPKEFEETNLKVKVTGELFNGEGLPAPGIGGQRIYFLKIKRINREQTK